MSQLLRIIKIKTNLISGSAEQNKIEEIDITASPEEKTAILNAMNYRIMSSIPRIVDGTISVGKFITDIVAFRARANAIKKATAVFPEVAKKMSVVSSALPEIDTKDIIKEASRARVPAETLIKEKNTVEEIGKLVPGGTVEFTVEEAKKLEKGIIPKIIRWMDKKAKEAGKEYIKQMTKEAQYNKEISKSLIQYIDKNPKIEEVFGKTTNSINRELLQNYFKLYSIQDKMSKTINMAELGQLENYRNVIENRTYDLLAGIKDEKDYLNLIKDAGKFMGKSRASIEGMNAAIAAKREFALFSGLSVDDLTRKYYKPVLQKDIKSIRDKIDVKESKNIIFKTAKELGLNKFENIPEKELTLGQKIERDFANAWDFGDAKKNFLKRMAYNFISRKERTFMDDIFEIFSSPEKVMEKDPVAKQIHDSIMFGLYKRETVFNKEMKIIEDLYKKVGFKKGGTEDKILNSLLHKYKEWNEVVKDFSKISAEKGINKEQLKVLEPIFKHYRERFDYFASFQHTLDNKKLGAGHTISAYMRINYSHPEVYNELKLKYDQLTDKQKVVGLIKEEKEMLKTIAGLIRNVDKMEQIKKAFLPAQEYLPHLKNRKLTGLLTENINASSMFADYVDNFSRTVYNEPILQFVRENVNNIKDPFIKSYANWFARRNFGLLVEDDFVKRTSKILSSMMYLRSIGFNVRTAIVNLTQSINTIVETGVTNTLQGVNHILQKSPIYKEAFLNSPFKPTFEEFQKTFVEKGIPIFNKTSDAAFYLMKKTEFTNRSIAYMSGYVEAMKNPKIVSDMLKRGFSLEEAAGMRGLEVLKRAQFVYGKAGMPKIFDNSVLRPVMTFMTYPIKQAELFINWANNNPEKLVSYLWLASRITDTAESLGLDLLNAVNAGIDIKQIQKGLKKLGTDNSMAMAYFKNSIDPTHTGSGFLPTSFVPGYDLIQGTVESLITDPTFKNKMFKSMGNIAIFVSRGDFYSAAKEMGGATKVASELSIPLSQQAARLTALKEGPKFTTRALIQDSEDGKIMPVFEQGLFYSLKDKNDNVQYLMRIDELVNEMIGGNTIARRQQRLFAIGGDTLVKHIKTETDKLNKEVVMNFSDVIKANKGIATAKDDKTKKYYEEIKKLNQERLKLNLKKMIALNPTINTDTIINNLYSKTMKENVPGYILNISKNLKKILIHNYKNKSEIIDNEVQKNINMIVNAITEYEANE